MCVGVCMYAEPVFEKQMVEISCFKANKASFQQRDSISQKVVFLHKFAMATLQPEFELLQASFSRAFFVNAHKGGGLSNVLQWTLLNHFQARAQAHTLAWQRMCTHLHTRKDSGEKRGLYMSFPAWAAPVGRV